MVYTGRATVETLGPDEAEELIAQAGISPTDSP